MLMIEELWFRMSLNEQMTNIGGEVERIIRKIELGEVSNIKEDGSVKTAIRGFDCSKRDPKNRGLLKEIEKAEQEFFQLLNKTKRYKSRELKKEIDEIKQYWNGFLQGYCAEISHEKIFYFMVQGHEDWNHDDDKWLGIYDNIRELKEAYKRALEGLRVDIENDCIASDEEVMVYLFDSSDVNRHGGMFYKRINPDEL